MTTTFRSDIVAGMLTMVQAFITANPTQLKTVVRVRPMSLTGEFPRAYLDLRTESITHANGIRTRTMSPSVVVVDQLTSNDETLDRLDDLVDLLVDWFTGYPHIVTGTVWDAMTVSDESEELAEGKPTAAVRFTFRNIELIEGRT